MHRNALIAALLVTTIATAAFAQGKSYRLPSVSIKPRIIWSSQSEEPEGSGLAFGGQDQQGEDGNPHTRIKVDGQWVAVHEDEVGGLTHLNRTYVAQGAEQLGGSACGGDDGLHRRHPRLYHQLQLARDGAVAHG